ncbi:MAG: epimerase [Omnitrophica WOR_2 bacterium SM23_72]|nr:MAG: epimerase [Omnitrophica WOR_2 bacterium SM23_72]
MKILITGGSGFLGINLVRYFFEKGINDIRTLDVADFDYPEKHRIEEVKGDIRNRGDVAKAMKDVWLVVNTATALPLYKKKDIYSTNVQGTANLLEEAYKNNVDRFIHISSTTVYGIPDHHPLYEDDKLEGVGDYGQAKIMAEEVCKEYRQKGMCIPIIRPKSFIGPERLGVFALFYEWAKDGKNFPMIGSGNNRYQLLDVEDLCSAIFLCVIKDRRIVNDTFNIGAKEFTTMKEDYQAVLNEAGYGKKLIPFPVYPAIWVLRILEFLHLSPLYKWIYETVCKDSFLSIEKAEKFLDFSPKYSNKEALIRNYQWYLKNLNNIKGKSGISHRIPWDQGILKVFKIFF